MLADQQLLNLLFGFSLEMRKDKTNNLGDLISLGNLQYLSEDLIRRK